MSLDGIFLRHIAKELRQDALGGRIAQIYQPNKDELVFILRTFTGSKRLLISARANSPRVHFTNHPPENPASPPMFCMLLRKKLGSGKLTDIRQEGLERTLFFDFDTVNELGDCVKLTVAAEIMGKYSNVILIGENGLIIDSLKRVDMTTSNLRLVLPNLKYELPPAQDKLDPLSFDMYKAADRVLSAGQPLSKAILNSIRGVSPVVCREIEYNLEKSGSLSGACSGQRLRELLGEQLENLGKIASDCSGKPYMLIRENDEPFDFTFLSVAQYVGAARIKEYGSFSLLLDSYYSERDAAERMRFSARDLFKLVTTVTERLSRKINTQRAELSACENREILRICGDLLQANLYRIPKGCKSITVENFYDENNSKLTIPLNPALSPAANSQKYYKDYRKAKNGERMLKEQLEAAERELIYIHSVADELSRARTEKELAQIRLELAEQGLIKAPKGKARPPAALEPLKFVSADGFVILVGRNNRQNDKLTFKIAGKNDIWFHTKDIHGSHTVLFTGGETPSEHALFQAASLAAYHSKARGSGNIPVDFTPVRYVSKPSGAKPGMVIYTNQKTLYVDASIPNGIKEQSD